MEIQEIRTFGRRHGKKLSARQQWLIENALPTPKPGDANGAILEIGFGAGEHVRDLAVTNPDKIIIGAEPFMNGVASIMSAITDAKTNEILPEYKNIRIFPDDVRDFLRATDSKFEQIWILHPDPWPKARHEKRRLLQTEFIKLLASRLGPDGEIIIGTD
ncbi:tRNA (guanosine(46)-N7)-methyltransferase TrmB, partial [bacterium]|nr:tRNA (guanosine(46)-N7)-methyltransferase TrmB [bacterium]